MPTTMDAILATIVAGRQAKIQLNIRMIHIDSNKSLQQRPQKYMRKATCPSGGMDLLNQRRWRGERLCHLGDGVWKIACAFCVVSQLVTHQSGSPYVNKVPQHNLKMRLKVLLFVPH
jgi:hypothetical protein